jgi:hypothetical protein
MAASTSSAVCGSVDIESIFDADADLLLWNVYAGLDGKHRTNFQGLVGIKWIMHVDAYGMSQTVHEVFSQRVTVQIFSMGVDVVESHLVQVIVAGIRCAMVHSAHL